MTETSPTTQQPIPVPTDAETQSFACKVEAFHASLSPKERRLYASLIAYAAVAGAPDVCAYDDPAWQSANVNLRPLFETLFADFIRRDG